MLLDRGATGASSAGGWLASAGHETGGLHEPLVPTMT
jgi:hypothetical protein